MKAIDLFRSFHQTPILLYPIHRQLTGSATRGILLAYLIRQMAFFEKEQIFQRDDDIKRATGLSRDELWGAKSHLQKMGILKIERKGAKGVCNYTLMPDRLTVLLTEIPETALLTEIPEAQTVLLTEIPETHIREKSNTKEKNGPTSADAEDGMHLKFKFLSMAEQLYHAIRQRVKINKTHELKRWARSFQLLRVRDEVSCKRIRQALKWYADYFSERYGTEYFINAQSGEAFRKKFSSIESAMARENTKKQEDRGDEGPTPSRKGKSTCVGETVVVKGLWQPDLEEDGN